MGRISRRKCFALVLLMGMAQRKRRHRFWIHPMIQQRRRKGDFYHLIQELRLDSDRHYQYFRMSAQKMDELLSMIGPDLRRQCTTYRAAIEPQQRLAVGLRFLASGDSFASLASSYRLGETTVRNCVYMVCRAVEHVMMGQYLPPPTEDMWREVAEGFWRKWNFPNCLGALDGKHIVIDKPPHSGSQYLTYKKTFTMILMALVDADYRFRVINVADYGHSSDKGIYEASALGIGMEQGTLHVPPNAPLPGDTTETTMPHVIVADAAFPLKTYLMRPYPGLHTDHDKKIYNYRLSRARTVVENAFEILASRWRILYHRINLLPDNVDSVLMAACILHNFLLSPSESQQLLEDAQQHGKQMLPVENMAGHRSSAQARAVRDRFCAYFNSPDGRVPWQAKMV